MIKLPAPTPAPLSTSTLWQRHKTGSYKSYYGARRPPSSTYTPTPTSSSSLQQQQQLEKYTADARISLLQPDWFQDKVYLDIGTNTGKLAFEIYRHFHPTRMVAVDIDAELIAVAREKLAWASKRDGVRHEDKVEFRCENVVSETGEKQEEGTVQPQADLEAAVLPSPRPLYDIITCFSVTKHIHLQGGDKGLLHIFHKIHSLLRPGGRFILEPQPWKGYRKRRHASKESAANYSSLKLRPPFLDVLVGGREEDEEEGEKEGRSKGLFARVEVLGVPPNAPVGFQRPLYCFVKREEEGGEQGEEGGKGKGEVMNLKK